MHVRGPMACIAIPPTALRMPIITQFDVCRNNAVSRDSVTRELGRGAKRSEGGERAESKGLSRIVISSTRFARNRRLRRIRVLYCYPCCRQARDLFHEAGDTCNGSLCILMTRVLLKLWHLTPRVFNRANRGVMRETRDGRWQKCGGQV